MIRTFRLLLALALALVVPLSLSAPGAFGRTQHRGNFFQRHKTLSALGAGLAAHHIAKHTGSSRMANGGHRNFLQRHPVLTGLGAAALTHHALSRSQRHSMHR